MAKEKKSVSAKNSKYKLMLIDIDQICYNILHVLRVMPQSYALHGTEVCQDMVLREVQKCQ